MDYTITQLKESFWAIEQNGVRCFLIEGKDYSLLIDTCFGGDLKSVCETLTDKPIHLITTHSDGDHTGSDEQFDKHYMHPCEFDYYFKKKNQMNSISPVWENDVIDLGNYTFEILLIPGHTPGSIALLEKDKHFIISGDTLQFNNSIFMFGDGRNLHALLCTLKKLNDMYKNNVFNTAYASHGQTEISAEIIADEIILAEKLLNNDTDIAEYDSPERFPDSVKIYQHNNAKMLYQK